MESFVPVFEKNISPLIENTFPEFYREHGPVFVEFVRQYYSWLESSQTVADKSFITDNNGTLIVNAKSPIVTGNGTSLFTQIAPGNKIAIFHEDSTTNYNIFTINSVANNTYLTLTPDLLPDFSSSNSIFATTNNQYNPNYYLRRFAENKDVDSTASQFLVYFKEKYLKNIQYDTKTNITNLLKHSLDIYRSKGTERSLDLVFRAIFDVPAKVYYPKDDIFRLSDGRWYRPTYLELSLKKDTEKLVGKQIIGAKSGALAFAEALVRRTVKNRFIDVLYISSVKGNFEVDEPINSSDSVIATYDRPIVIGSLTNLDVDSTGSGDFFEVGDVVDLYSDWGEQGRGRVQAITDTSGKVDFTLTNGGYGYTANAEVVVSEKIFVMSNVVISANNLAGKSYVYEFESVVQPLANVIYKSRSTSGNYANGDMLFTYHANNSLDGTGIVVKTTPNTTTNGSLLISVLSGSFNKTNFYTAGNAISANIVSHANSSMTANVVGYYSNVIFSFNTQVGSFSIGEEVAQYNQYSQKIANGVALSLSSADGSQTIKVGNTMGVFNTGSNIVGLNSNASANIESITLYVGVKDIVNTPIYSQNNVITFSNSGTTATMTNYSIGDLANCSISTNLIFTEIVSIGTDYLRDYLTISLNALAYGFPKMPSGNLTNGTLSQILDFEAYTIGKIAYITNINKGSNYSLAPVARVYEPLVLPMFKQDLILAINNVSGIFLPGEIVSQSAVGSRGLVKTANATHVYVEQLRANTSNNFVLTSNSTTILYGENSETTANVANVIIDSTSEYLGFNAMIDTDVRSNPGGVTSLAVINSGFGYKKADSIRFVKTGDSKESEHAGLAFANVQTQGFGEGYYKVKGGFLSDQKKLHDGIYYQEYSYEIRSSVMLNKYEEMLKKLLHLAGTKYFGAFVYTTQIGSKSEAKSMIVSQS